MTCSGPGTMNSVPAAAHAFADGAPVVFIGGSAAMFQRTTGVFQETDQVALFAPVTKWSHQVPDTDAIPDMIARAFQIATTGAPGPVYLDFPPTCSTERAARMLMPSRSWRHDRLHVAPQRRK